MRFISKILFFLLLVTLNACVTTKIITIQQTAPAVFERQNIATAGAVSIDITPPPGLSMGGYSVMANRGVGFRTRLKARVVYLADDTGQAIALVQTDLTAASLLLHHKVSAAVAKKTGLKSGDIAITASHSHSAPANIFENDFYNKHMSSEKWLNEHFLAFLTQRISKGIIEAYEKRRPAKVSTGSKKVYGYNRNRSISAYVLNANINNIDLDDRQSIFEAVNPTLNMIRIDVQNRQGDFLPLAAFSSFSVHATALSPKVEVYNADLFAYAQKDLEWYIANKYQTDWPVVHAMTTGTQGDMAPALAFQGDNYFRHFDVNWREAKRLGKGIGHEAIQLFESLSAGLTSDIKLRTSAREINIRNSVSLMGSGLCSDAAVGSPVVGGAFERRTPWLSIIPFFRAGNIMSHRWFFTNGCQGNKSHAGFSFIQPLFEPKDGFPKIVMFQLIRINDAVILPLPFEVTVEAGRRIVSSVKNELDDSDAQVWLASNANGYFGYATTAEEYDQQNYEGGHTLYGRNSTSYLGKKLALLTRDMIHQGNIHEMLSPWRYELGVNSSYPKLDDSLGKRSVISQPEIYLAAHREKEDYIYFKWQDVGPNEIKFHEPLVKVQVYEQRNNQWLLLDVDAEPINDDGYDIEVRYINSTNKGMAEYEARWYNPLIGGEYRFVIAARNNQTRLVSKGFIYGREGGLKLEN